ncbi:hypothetical protein [Kozakia baliensis]|uniref:Uncharacterized protein n=1 Tax=Kozakia baliensis TaxID=153496 RepID=A0A1D8UWH0_9PROT|nr:hypothetical protein [Kozakia baliensis]AOX17961.1 hypothetical protein A0U89_13430 [Kozakia baliensis]AOX20839.1 hypothetical protein A0U90_11750 [Kozakia baliensis]GBR26194.1 hypothetical protein AA0488_0840 [Kozakia baliensis NRIC 0488]GEL64420.1 hypothetical protein KBA01_17060 [Kozakia baliensis]
MFGKKNKAPVTDLTEEKTKGCGIKKACCAAKPQTKEAVLGTLTFLSMFGPKKVRPHVQHLLALISIVTLIVKAVQSRREKKEA